MLFVNIHDGNVCTLDKPIPFTLPQTFDMIFVQYHQHLETKSLAPDENGCEKDTRGLLKRYPVTATAFQYIGKETERGWEQADDISTLLPSLVRYQNSGIAGERLRQRLRQIPLTVLERDTGLSRHTILRARRGERVHSRTLQHLRIAVQTSE